TSMLKFARCFFSCAAIVTLLVVATEGTVRAGQESAGPLKKITQTKKTSKKRKKTRSVVPVIVMVSPNRATQSAQLPLAPAAPVVGNFDMPAVPVSRGTITA